MTITWRTKKEDNGTFTALCYGVEYKKMTKLGMATGNCSRAIAKRRAQGLARYWKAELQKTA